MTDKKCKKLGDRATQREIKQAHIDKMEMKAAMREHQYHDYANSPQPHVFANLSKNHEHYGDTPHEHEARKKSS